MGSGTIPAHKPTDAKSFLVWKTSEPFWILVVNDRLLTCRGFELEGYVIPSFEVRSGEAVSLLLPSWLKHERELRDCLTGALSRSEIESAARCVSVVPASPQTGIRGWFFNTMPLTWLMDRGLTRSEAATILNRHDINERIPIGQLASSPRTLIGLEAAYHLRPDVVVFAMSGLDPLGRHAVVDLVRTHLGRTGFVCLTYPTTTNGISKYLPFPESNTFEVSSRSHVAV